MKNTLPNLTEQDFSRWPHFSRREMACRLTGECRMDPVFMDQLELLRTRFGRPMPVNSGYRSPEHNLKVSSTGETGPHTYGKAADIVVARGDAWRLLQLALSMGFTGIGIAQKGASRYIHLDTLTAEEAAPGPRPTVWSY